MLDDIEKDNLSEEEKETLVELGFLCIDAEEEKQEMLDFMDELNAVNRKIKAILC